MTEQAAVKTPRIPAALGTPMMVTFARSSNVLKALFVGMEQGGYLVLRFPSGAAGVHDHLYEGNEAVIKFVSDGSVYGFRTEVLGYMYKRRLILVVFRFPAGIETHALRKEKRIEFLAPGVLTVAGNNIPGFIVDLSPSGCRFTYDLTPENSSLDFTVIRELTLSFQIVGREGSQKAGCQVKSVQLEAPGAVYLGLAFSNPDETIATAIRDYVDQVAGFFNRW